MVDVTQRTSLFRTCISAGAITALASAVCIAFSAPMLTRPIVPGLALNVLAPFAVGFFICFLLSLLLWQFTKSFQYGQALLLPVIMLSAAPWWFIAHAAEAERQWVVLPVLVILVVGVLFLPKLTGRGGKIVVSIASLVILLPSDRKWDPATNDTLVPTLVIGLDDAPWQVVDELIRRGELPNLKKILDRGIVSKFRSPILLEDWSLCQSAFSGYSSYVDESLFSIRQERFPDEDNLFESVSSIGADVGVGGFPILLKSNDRLTNFTPYRNGDYLEEWSTEINYLIYLDGFHWNLGLEDLLTREGGYWALSSLANSSAKHFWQNLRQGMKLLPDGGDSGRDPWRKNIVTDNIWMDGLTNFVHRHDPLLAAVNLAPSGGFTMREQSCLFLHEDGKHLDEEISCSLIHYLRLVDETVGNLTAGVSDPDVNLILISVRGTQLVKESDTYFGPYVMEKIEESHMPELEGRFVGNFQRIGDFMVFQFYGLAEERIWKAKMKAWERVQIQSDPPTPWFASIHFEENSNALIFELSEVGKGIAPFVVQVDTDEIVVGPAERYGTHREVLSNEGRVVFCGPAIQKPMRLSDRSILDIAPTIRAMMKLNVDQGMVGRNLLMDQIPQ